MPFKQEGSQANTFGTYNDIQGNQQNYVIYQTLTGGTPQQPLLLSEATQPYLHKYMLPSPPELMIGRDKEKSDIVDTLLQKPPARVAILGGGGMGKTTLALSILHEGAVADKYTSRYFVSCEGVLSISSLIEEIANTLRIPPAQRDTFLMNTIFSTFPNMTLLCLDNFETLWDDEARRPEIEEFLSLLQHQVLGLIITMRGAQRPSRVFWSKPLLSPLRPVTDDISRRIFEEMTGDSCDEFVERLLTAVDGIPLAISLISALLQEGFESSESLWSRWQTQSGVLECGGKHRLSNLDTSIHLSVYGPRMLEDPTTIDILAMLSMLPDGLPDDGKVMEELQRHLPEGYHLQKALLTMQRVSLVQVVQVDGAAVHRRVRMLSPIQSFCRGTLAGSEELSDSITSFYVQKILDFADCEDPAGHAIIPSELHNVHAVLMQALRRGKGNTSIVVASMQFTSWSMYLGNPVEEVVHAAMQGVVGQPELLGSCHDMMGEVLLQQSKLDQAEESFKCAVTLHQQAQNIIGEGISIGSLGDVYLGQSKLDEAVASLKRAIELQKQAHHIFGEANSLATLGEVYLRQDKSDEAEASSKRAIEIYKQAHSALGEGNSLWTLAGVYLGQSKLDEAEESSKRAIELYKQVHSVLGEGNGLGTLAEVYLRQSKLDKAEGSSKRAIELHKQVHSVLGEGNGLARLGEVYLRQDKLDEAEESLKRAIELHQQAHEFGGEGDDLQHLGGVYLRRDKLDEAEESLKRAVELHQQAHDVFGEGNDLRKLGELHLRRDELDEAEASFKRATELHQHARDIFGEGNTLHNLGELYMRRDNLHAAEVSFERAAELHRKAHDVAGEGRDLEKLETVRLRRSQLDQSEAPLKHDDKPPSVHGEANRVLPLGQVHSQRLQLDEANVSSGGATEFHRPAHSVLRDDAGGVRNVGHVDGNIPPWPVIPAQDQEPSQHQPKKLTFRKKISVLFSSRHK